MICSHHILTNLMRMENSKLFVTACVCQPLLIEYERHGAMNEVDHVMLFLPRVFDKHTLCHDGTTVILKQLLVACMAIYPGKTES